MNFDHDKIEDYVFGRLGEEERAAFQFALLRDAGLRREVETVRALRGVARAKQAKRGRLLFFYQKKWVRVAAVFIGVLTLGALIAFFSREKKQDFVKKDKLPNIEQKQDFLDDTSGYVSAPVDSFQFQVGTSQMAGTGYRMEIVNGDTIYIKMIEVNIKDSIFWVDMDDRDSILAEALLQEMKVFPKEVKLGFWPKHSDSDPYLYNLSPASPQNPDAWEPNPVLEKHIGAAGQNDSLVVDFSTGGQPFVRDSSGWTNINFKCNVYGQFEDSVTLKIYSNKEADFKLNRPMAVAKIEVDGLGNHLKGKFNLGLYYVLFERKNGEILGVNKFTVIERQPFNYTFSLGGALEPRIGKLKSFLQESFGKKKGEKTESANPDRYSPNLALEKYINQKYSRKLELFLFDAYYPDAAGNTQVQIAMRTKEPASSDWYLSIYSNLEAEWEDKYPLMNEPLHNTLDETSQQTFEAFFTYKGNFKPGLYYLVIKDSDRNGNILAVDKFEVKSEE